MAPEPKIKVMTHTSHRVANETGNYQVNLFKNTDPNTMVIEVYSTTPEGEFDQEYHEQLKLTVNGYLVTGYTGAYRLPEECGVVLMAEGYYTHLVE